MKTTDVLEEYNVSRQSLYNWVKYDNLNIDRDIRGHYIWNEKSILNLKEFIADRKERNIDTSNKCVETRFCLKNRRYLGAKTRLLPFIKEVVDKHTKDVNLVADIFGGTGVVSDFFLREGKNVIVNDILKSNYVIYHAFFGDENVDDKIVVKYVNEMNNLKARKNYVSENYGDKYFTMYNAMKIGEAREYIERKRNLNKREKAILLTSILFAMDKVANTVGHYDSYRKKLDMIEPIHFKIPDYYQLDKRRVSFSSKDANLLIREIHPDLIYIDTPYNSRQYGDVYHVLENIVTWKKPELFGVARKPHDRRDTKSLYSTSKAPKAFEDLIGNIQSKYVLVSYNNMAQKGTGRSNAKISNEEIISILEKRGKVEVFSTDFQAFTTGKSDIKGHKELLYLLTIGDER